MPRRSNGRIFALLLVWAVIGVLVAFRTLLFAIIGWAVVSFLVLLGVVLMFVRLDREETTLSPALRYWDAEFNVEKRVEGQPQ
jgi:hypothetical protein